MKHKKEVLTWSVYEIVRFLLAITVLIIGIMFLKNISNKSQLNESDNSSIIANTTAVEDNNLTWVNITLEYPTSYNFNCTFKSISNSHNLFENRSLIFTEDPTELPNIRSQASEEMLFDTITDFPLLCMITQDYECDDFIAYKYPYYYIHDICTDKKYRLDEKCSGEFEMKRTKREAYCCTQDRDNICSNIYLSSTTYYAECECE